MFSDYYHNESSKRYICNKCNSIIITVIHRTAPELKPEEIIEECTAATKWAYENAQEYGGDKNKIVLFGVGQSANLSLSVSLKLKEKNEISLIKLLVLISPILSFKFDTKSWKTYGNGDFGISQKQFEWLYSVYNPLYNSHDSPLLSPLLASNFIHFPNVILFSAGFDPHLDHCKAIVTKMMKSGIHVTHQHYTSFIYSFFENIFLPMCREKSHLRITELITKALEK